MSSNDFYLYFRLPSDTKSFDIKFISTILSSTIYNEILATKYLRIWNFNIWIISINILASWRKIN